MQYLPHKDGVVVKSTQLQQLPWSCTDPAHVKIWHRRWGAATATRGGHRRFTLLRSGAGECTVLAKDSWSKWAAHRKNMRTMLPWGRWLRLETNPNSGGQILCWMTLLCRRIWTWWRPSADYTPESIGFPDLWDVAWPGGGAASGREKACDQTAVADETHTHTHTHKKPAAEELMLPPGVEIDPPGGSTVRN
jgi:hypothetical protein